VRSRGLHGPFALQRGTQMMKPGPTSQQERGLAVLMTRMMITQVAMKVMTVTMKRTKSSHQLLASRYRTVTTY
jgi:hypothetical protein